MRSLNPEKKTHPLQNIHYSTIIWHNFHFSSTLCIYMRTYSNFATPDIQNTSKELYAVSAYTSKRHRYSTIWRMPKMAANNIQHSEMLLFQQHPRNTHTQMVRCWASCVYKITLSAMHECASITYTRTRNYVAMFACMHYLSVSVPYVYLHITSAST